MSDHSSDESIRSIGKNKRKKNGDPNAPKRAKSAYSFFAEAKRTKIKMTNPDIVNFGEIQRIIGAAWRALTPTERTKWNNMALKDRERLADEMFTYRNPSLSKNKEVSLLEIYQDWHNYQRLY